MKIQVINGANMDVLERREAIYGGFSLKELEAKIADYAHGKNIEVDFFHSNSEGAIIDKLHECFSYDGIIINSGAYSHYSYAIADALSILDIPKIEVHLTDIMSREEFRHNLVTGVRCDKVISGMGIEGYLRAIDECLQLNKKRVSKK